MSEGCSSDTSVSFYLGGGCHKILLMLLVGGEHPVAIDKTLAPTICITDVHIVTTDRMLRLA